MRYFRITWKLVFNDEIMAVQTQDSILNNKTTSFVAFDRMIMVLSCYMKLKTHPCIYHAHLVTEIESRCKGVLNMLF